MKCPVCENANLMMTERSGIEIDYCPQCRGVWLDRGELDKIIERSSREDAERDNARRPERPDPNGFGQQGAYRKDGDRYNERHHERDHRHHHGKKSLWHELFD